MTVILITGATGLIGFRILVAALEAGYTVRYIARSVEKALAVTSNPAIQKLALDDNRLSSIIIPDPTVDGAFDTALQGVTHVIHAGSPVPVHDGPDPTTQVFQSTLKMSSNLLASALKVPTLKRVVITSSIHGNSPFEGPSTIPVTGSSRLPLPNPVPSTFSNGPEAYVFAKIIQLHDSDEFVKTHNPHFAISHIMPGYVFGRNELALDATMMQLQNSTNAFLMAGMLGNEPSMPLHEAFAHVDDVADVHLKVAFLDPQAEPKDYGVTSKVDYSTIFGHVKKAFPEAVASGVFKEANFPSMPINYDSSESEKLLGRKFKTFETAVVDVASQYLEKIGKNKA